MLPVRPWFSQPKKTPWMCGYFPANHVDDYQRATVTNFFTSFFTFNPSVIWCSVVESRELMLTVTKVQASISLWTININQYQSCPGKKNMKKLDLPLPLWSLWICFWNPTDRSRNFTFARSPSSGFPSDGHFEEGFFGHFGGHIGLTVDASLVELAKTEKDLDGWKLELTLCATTGVVFMPMRYMVKFSSWKFRTVLLSISYNLAPRHSMSLLGNTYIIVKSSSSLSNFQMLLSLQGTEMFFATLRHSFFEYDRIQDPTRWQIRSCLGNDQTSNVVAIIQFHS